MFYYDVLWCFMMYQNWSCFIIYALISPTDFPMMGLSKNRGQACPNGRAKGGEPPVLDVGEYTGISLDRMEIWWNIWIPLYWLGNITGYDEVCLVFLVLVFDLHSFVLFSSGRDLRCLTEWFFSWNSIPLVVRGNSPMIGNFFPFNENNQHSESVIPQNCFNQMVNQSLIGGITDFAVQSNPITTQRDFCDQTWLVVRWIFPLKWP